MNAQPSPIIPNALFPPELFGSPKEYKLMFFIKGFFRKFYTILT